MSHCITKYLTELWCEKCTAAGTTIFSSQRNIWRPNEKVLWDFFLVTYLNLASVNHYLPLTLLKILREWLSLSYSSFQVNMNTWSRGESHVPIIKSWAKWSGSFKQGYNIETTLGQSWSCLLPVVVEVCEVAWIRNSSSDMILYDWSQNELILQEDNLLV